MQSWTTKTGFPVIHAKVVPTELKVAQERFYFNRSTIRSNATLWPVPLLPSQLLSSDMFRDQETTILANDLNSQFLINKGKGGF